MLDILTETHESAARAGVTLTPDDVAAMEALQRAELARIASTEVDSTPGFIAAFNRHFPRILSALHSIGDTALALSRTVIVAFFVPVVLALLLIVEINRVSLGVGLFEPDGAIAAFAATSIVLLNLTIELVIDYTETRAAYAERRARRWSLRLLAIDLAYRLGIGQDWQPLELSPAARYRRLRSIVTCAILALALAGSMRTAIETTPGTWYQALGAILTQSTLSTASVWVSGVIFAFAAVLSAQSLSRYVSVRTVEVLAAMNAQAGNAAHNERTALDRIAANYIQAKIAQQQQAEAERERERERLEALQERERQQAEAEAERRRQDTEAERQRQEAERRRQERRAARDRRQPAQGDTVPFLLKPVPAPMNGNGHTNGHAKEGETR